MKETWVPMVRPYCLDIRDKNRQETARKTQVLRPYFWKVIRMISKLSGLSHQHVVKWIISPRIWVKMCFKKIKKRNHLKKTFP